LLRNASLYDLLFTVDRDLAAEARAAGCRTCGGRSHSARYPRKLRGGLEELGPDYTTRLSFCCEREGCRRRTPPPSVRFLGRRVYLGAVVVLVTAMQAGITQTRAERLRELVGVSPRTLKRWREWWQTTFVASAFWRAVKGRFMPSVNVAAIPASLLDRFAGPDALTQLLHLRRFLCPLTTRTGALGSSFTRAASDPQTMRLVTPPLRS
jgi:hypothetical protein